jgi:serine/threonine protein kinase
MICAHCGKDTESSPCAHCGSPTLLDGRFRLERLVGQGASACTYQARDADGRSVAIKELPLRRAKNDKALELFHREARVLKQLKHPAIPAWIEDFIYGEGKQKALYIVQEFVDGTSLADELDAHRYDEDEVLDIVDELAEVLDYLHTRSPPVIHRDIKPDNVLRRSADNRLMLVDFGSVRDCLKHPEFGGSTVTGTFGYMAPEQYRGDATPCSDVYGLGALGITLLSRRPPHTMLDLHRKLHFRDHVRSTTPVLKLFDSLLQVDPDDRIQSAEGVQAAIDIARGLIPIGAAPPGMPYPPKPQASATHRAPIWRLLAPIMAIGFIIGVTWLSRPPPAITTAPVPITIETKPLPKKTTTTTTTTTTTIATLPPSNVPPEIRLQHTLNALPPVRECFKHHGANVRESIPVSISVAPPNTLQEALVPAADYPGRIGHCLKSAIEAGPIAVPFMRHWEGTVHLMRSDHVGNHIRVRTAPKDETNSRAMLSIVRRVRDRCVSPTQSMKPPRHIGADIKIGQNGRVQNVSIQPRSEDGSARAACLKEILEGARVDAEGFVATVWWYWDSGQSPTEAQP